MPGFKLYKIKIISLLCTTGFFHSLSALPLHHFSITPVSLPASLVTCDCAITQDGNTYPISALEGSEEASLFYSYGNPNASSANTGLELSNALILFLYEDINTGIISLFLIADIANSGSGGSLSFEFNCVPATAYIAVQDDSGEFGGSPPLFTGNWSWGTCCTDGGVIEDIGCNTTMNLDLVVASGIDSIVWLTGDIANPTHILLDLGGSAITINCGGGGVCCPVGFDTGITVTDATCPDSPNGSIELAPQDGLPPYSYNWSNGNNMSLNSGLIPGSYQVTVTDAQGCTEELDIAVNVSPGAPPAQPASIQLCSVNAMDLFDLTSVNDIVNLGSGFNVLWFQNSDLTGSISVPTNYLSGSSTVYAVVDNGSCLSAPVPVDLEILTQPIANPTSINMCEENNDMTTFDLTTLDGTVSGGIGNVLWYLDPNLVSPISDPSQFLSGNVTVYAAVQDGPCISDPVEVDLIVDPKPDGDPTQTHLCGDDNDQAIFDLTLLEPTVSAGNGTITWYLEIELYDQITAPNAFLTSTTTVYAVVFDGICNSDPVPVDLIVDPTPVGIPTTVAKCDDGSGEALFNLFDYALQVSGGIGGVDWFWDPTFIDPIPNPMGLLTETTIVFARIDNGTCVSNPVQVDLVVQESPVGHPSFLETCADSSGQGTFVLTNADTLVSGGTGSVQWFEDAQGLIPIVNTNAYVSAGSTVFAQVNDGVCLSQIVPVDLIIINSVSAVPVQYSLCDDGSGVAIFNLLNIAGQVSGGTGQVNWFIDSLGNIVIATPDMFMSGDTTVYASVTAGTCISNIVPVDLSVLSSATATGMSLSLCGDTSGMIIYNLTSLDTLISGNTGNVTWYGDSALAMAISNPTTFMTGDTNIYATVSIGSCISSPAEIILSVSTELFANAQVLQFCKPFGDTLMIDLTVYDNSIGGANQVNWFMDSFGMIPITSPDSFPGLISLTLYADITNGICTSALVPVNLFILDQPVANPYSIMRCGDTNGQVTVDLTTVDPLISNNTGLVTWYADVANNVPIVNNTSFTSGDTILYATVTNGFCISPTVPITLQIVDSLVANPTIIQVCVLDSNTAMIDLTQSDIIIDGGNGTVTWFSDNLGANIISNPATYTSGNDTVYAMVEADGCISNLAAIPIQIESSSYPIPACDFTSIDSISIIWSSVTTDYQIFFKLNGLMGDPLITQLNSFNIGGLGQGDTLTFTVTALYDSICTTPLSNTITCITDVCPSQAIGFPGLQSAYCRDVPFIVINTTPVGGQLSGKGISGDTLYPNLVIGNSTSINYTWNNNVSGCTYDSAVQVQIFDPLIAPVVDCQSETLSSVTFDWSPASGQFGYEYVINNGASSGILQTANTSLLINNLNEGDKVTLSVWSIGSLPCGNSDTVSISCTAKQCPFATLAIPNPGFLCSDGNPIMLDVMINGLSGNPSITWSGKGIANPSGLFDPSLVASGMGDDHTTVTVVVEDGGCTYTDSIFLEVLMTPIASFEVKGVPCLDSTLELVSNGFAYASSQWNWNFDGANAVQILFPIDYALHWDTPGNYTLGLIIDYHGCISNSFSVPVRIDAPLDPPQLNCLTEDFYSLSISWEPVIGATQYSVSSSLGPGRISGTTYTITNLPDDTTVSITVTALGPTACGPSSSTIECHTMDYIPPATFIPDIFSPNNDGVNDVFYIQSNDQITEVNALRIFDRWGNQVFEKTHFPPNDAQYGWDGSYSGKVLNPGVYVYWVELVVNGGQVITKSGDMTLMK